MSGEHKRNDNIQYSLLAARAQSGGSGIGGPAPPNLNGLLALLASTCLCSLLAKGVIVLAL
jgi:hypothetical protein